MKELLKAAAKVGAGAVHGFHASKGVAHAASKVPVIGHLLGTATVIGCTVYGAGHAAKEVLES